MLVYFLLQSQPSEHPLVRFFVNHDCPIARRYSPEMVRVSAKYKGKIRFQMVYCDQEVPEADLKKHHKEFKIPFGYMLDPKRKLAKQFQITAVPTVVMTDNKNKPLYQGRIDNAYGDDFKWRKPTQFDLRTAIDQFLQGKPITTPKTTAIGCLLG